MNKAEGLVEAIKALTPTVFAGFVVIGGMLMLYDLIKSNLVSADAGLAIITTIIGAAVAALFTQKTIADTAKAVTNGAATAAVARAREAENTTT